MPADERTGEGGERQMDIDPPLVANGEPTEAGEPAERALYHPTMPAQPLARFDTTPGDARDDAALAAGCPATVEVIPFVRVQLRRAPAWAAPETFDRPHRVEQRFEFLGIVDIGGRQRDREGDTTSVHQEVALRSWLAPVGRIRSRRDAPLLAGTDAASMLARDQSIRPRLPSRSSRRWWRRSQTPAACQSRSRRQQVTPLPQPSSTGSASHGQPVRNTNKMPVSAWRSERRGRPPFGFGGSAGSSGAISFHSSSDSRGVLILPVQHPASGFERHSKVRRRPWETDRDGGPRPVGRRRPGRSASTPARRRPPRSGRCRLHDGAG